MGKLPSHKWASLCNLEFGVKQECVCPYSCVWMQFHAVCAVKRNESRGLLFGCFLAVSTLCLIALELSAMENCLLPPLPLCHRNEGALRPAEHAGMKTMWDFDCKNICKNIFEGINNPYHWRIQIFWLLSLCQMPSIALLEYCFFFLKTWSSIPRMKGQSMY